MNPLRCPRCGLDYEATDNFCRRCGRSFRPGTGFFGSHGGIILLALVVGPFALPAVWMSKRISPAAKGIYTIILLVIGVYFMVACWKIYQLTLQASHALLGGF